MQNLSMATLACLPGAVKTPHYDLTHSGIGPGIGIVHLGPGAFHRAHQAVYTDLALQYGGDWAICGVSMRSTGARDKLAAQDNLYTLVVLDEQPYQQVIGSIREMLVLGEQRQQVMHRLSAESTYIISLTVTEKGYCLDNQGQLDLCHADVQADLQNPSEPVSAIGLLVAALKLRRAANLGKLSIISCDNLADNGKKLRAAVVAFARQLDPELANWISGHICFPCTMVDSITPATDENLPAQLVNDLGLYDAWPIQREAFSQWVIEDNFSGPRPQWEKVGVTFTADVSIFEKAKLRILNGTHSTIAYLGSLCGFESVFEAISDPAMFNLLKSMLDEQIIPSMEVPEELDLGQYSEAILSRYRNRHIRHLLAQIAWDGSQKLPFRILSTIRDNLSKGLPIDLLAIPLAAWMVFIVRRAREQVEIIDPLAKELAEIGNACSGEPASDVQNFLRLRAVFAELAENAEFVHGVTAAYGSLFQIRRDTMWQFFGALA